VASGLGLGLGSGLGLDMGPSFCSVPWTVSGLGLAPDSGLGFSLGSGGSGLELDMGLSTYLLGTMDSLGLGLGFEFGLSLSANAQDLGVPGCRPQLTKRRASAFNLKLSDAKLTKRRASAFILSLHPQRFHGAG